MRNGGALDSVAVYRASSYRKIKAKERPAVASFLPLWVLFDELRQIPLRATRRARNSRTRQGLANPGRRPPLSAASIVCLGDDVFLQVIACRDKMMPSAIRSAYGGAYRRVRPHQHDCARDGFSAARFIENVFQDLIPQVRRELRRGFLRRSDLGFLRRFFSVLAVRSEPRCSKGLLRVAWRPPVS